ncbi:class I SAM-dependent methyltransferase [Streptomyces sp. CBMA156]|uniref:class I SAM-dependent methyltransferase n=1 Tax=Streptomyces sp. CBMA156 TaxID=1930280 RepID=UPI001661AED3|nr:methyltransferase domain-containing protein [Streptomyces sp. CBMA156]MBD0673149.1 methyltransferase type 11 [Streptomyces sp. CBMA156]
MNATELTAKAPSIAAAMATADVSPGIQQAQTRYRAALVSGWDIPAGASVLEVGCGQGDTTAVLAEAVGPRGRVVAVDIADPSYGAPVTLGQSAKRLKATPLGSRIDFRFGLDVLDEAAITFPDGGCDHVVLAHCSWYFGSLDQLAATLVRVRRWARNLCFAEWDIEPRSAEQLPHLLAILIQGQIEAAGSRGEGNVRTPFSRESLLRTLSATGWNPAPAQAVDTTALQDGDWEVDACTTLLDDAHRMTQLPQTVRELVLSQGDAPLPAYSLTAR